MVLEIIAPVAAAVLAGVAWNTIGIWEAWRNHEDAEVDWKKVRKNAIIGAGLGLATWGYALTLGSEQLISTVKEFVLAVAGYFPLVVVVEKLLNRPDK